MSALQERQARRFLAFILALCGLLSAALLPCGLTQGGAAHRLAVQRQRGMVSGLLAQGVEPAVIARALGTVPTAQGDALLRALGYTERTDTRWLADAWALGLRAAGLLAAVGIAFAAVLLAGSAAFLMRRERVYGDAAQVLDAYAEGDFSRHLPVGEPGTLFRAFASAEQLAFALHAKGETERVQKEWMRDTLSDISHQLKTPLAALNLYMQIIREEPDNKETVGLFCEKAVQSTMRMERLIGMLLRMAQLDAGSIVFRRERCPVSELARRATRDLADRAQREGKALVFGADAYAELPCDADLTAEALGNLVKNALDHTEAGDTVRISWESLPAMIRIRVADSGCGIAPQDMRHLFERFYRSAASSDPQGVGLGLPLARAIVEGQGGVIDVDSAPGEGSVFTITFPS